MEHSPRIEFQGMASTAPIRDLVERRLINLEEKFGRLAACHVVIKAPGEHHRQGAPYEVKIRLALPGGRDVNVERTPDLDERHGRLEFAIDDAFNKARRQLQDRVRRMQGAMKAHEPHPIGTVTKVFREEGYGFLETSDGSEFYFHRNSVLNDAFARLVVGDRVNFAEEMGEKGPQASTISLLGKHDLK